ncbi:hypothetical protein ACC668_37730, partial [Rhizobium ruizarguesonis]
VLCGGGHAVSLETVNMGNRVSLGFIGADLIGQVVDADIVLAGDVFYDRAFADALVPWFAKLAADGKRVLVGDPGRSYLPRDRL